MKNHSRFNLLRWKEILINLRDFWVKELDDIWSLNVLQQKFLTKAAPVSQAQQMNNKYKKKKKPQQRASGLNTTEQYNAQNKLASKKENLMLPKRW